MKRETGPSKASVEQILHTFAELGIVKRVSLRLPSAGITDPASEWGKTFRPNVQTRAQPYGLVRDLQRMPLVSRATIRLSPSRQNSLLGRVVDEFCPRFTPGGKPVFVGDAGKKWTYFDADYLRKLGVTVKEHRKMPNVVVHFTQKNWLFLVLIATSHGPVNPRRLTELRSLFAGSKVGLVFATACLNHRDFSKYIGDIAWGTHLWIANAPDHLIHFGGESQ